MRRLYIIGDPHGYFEKLRYIAMRSKNSDYVCVGDINVGYHKKYKHLNMLYDMLPEWNEELKEDNNVMYFVRGNHDNPFYWFENKFNFSNIILVEDYTVLNLKKNVLCVGGALSIDRILSTEGVNYWKEEEFIYDEEKTLSINNADVVVTHSAPEFAFPRGLKSDLIDQYSYEDVNLRDELSVERLNLSRLFQVLMYNDNNNISEYYYGHFHRSNVEYHENVKFQLLDELEVAEVV